MELFTPPCVFTHQPLTVPCSLSHPVNTPPSQQDGRSETGTNFNLKSHDVKTEPTKLRISLSTLEFEEPENNMKTSSDTTFSGQQRGFEVTPVTGEYVLLQNNRTLWSKHHRGGGTTHAQEKNSAFDQWRNSVVSVLFVFRVFMI